MNSTIALTELRRHCEIILRFRTMHQNLHIIYRRTVLRDEAQGSRALQWSGNPYGNGYGVEMDGNGAQFVKILWIGLDLGRTVDLKR